MPRTNSFEMCLAILTRRTEYRRRISPQMTPSTCESRNYLGRLGRRLLVGRKGRRSGSTSGRGASTKLSVSAETTPARRRLFSSENPSRQRFSKTDLAKFENTWDQRPHVVSRGAQKNFTDFMVRISELDRKSIDRTYFERLIAKGILFRTAERIVQRQDFGGYRANIVTHTLALISNETSQRIDLEQIWREQALSAALQEVIADVSHEVHRIIVNPPEGRNITEWCKTERCWVAVCEEASRTAINNISGELLGVNETRREQKRSISNITAPHVENLRKIVQLNSEAWSLLAAWGTETDSLTPAQRQLALRIGRAIRLGREIKAVDAAGAVEIIDHANQRGFQVTA